jgi:hypothetical protein
MPTRSVRVKVNDSAQVAACKDSRRR